MPDYLVTYDFKVGAPSQYEVFVECAEVEGFTYVYPLRDELARLTNTTVWGVFADKQAAKAAFERAQAAADAQLGRRIVLEKRVITQMADLFVRSDRKKPRDVRWTMSTDLDTCRAHQRNDPFFAY